MVVPHHGCSKASPFLVNCYRSVMAFVNVNIPIILYSSSLLLVVSLLDGNKDAIVHGDKKSFLQLLLRAATFLCYVSLSASVLPMIGDIITRKRRSPIFDSEGKPVSTSMIRQMPPILPDPSHCSPKEYQLVRRSLATAHQAKQATQKISSKASWALVTGASKGIGRAIAISLARRRIPTVLVARDLQQLESICKEIHECYGVTAIPLKCDLTSALEVNQLVDKLHRKTIVTEGENEARLIDRIDVLINNAGLGDSRDFLDEDLSPETIMTILSLNVVGTTLLTKELGRAMKSVRASQQRISGGRIVMISSVMGIVPGIAGCAVYAATKAYQKSFCASLGREMELMTADGPPIAVTCVLPGGVSGTDFEKSAKMETSPVFWLPGSLGLSLTPDQVAETTVRATICGNQREVVIGFVYQITFHFFAEIFPARVTQLLSELLTRPWKTRPELKLPFAAHEKDE